jgi:hypothetical protein
VGHSLTGASVKDCTTSNSCLPSELVQAYWYVGTARSPCRTDRCRISTRTRRLPMMRHSGARVHVLSASVSFVSREGLIAATPVRDFAMASERFAGVRASMRCTATHRCNELPPGHSVPPRDHQAAHATSSACSWLPALGWHRWSGAYWLPISGSAVILGASCSRPAGARSTERCRTGGQRRPHPATWPEIGETAD